MTKENRAGWPGFSSVELDAVTSERGAMLAPETCLWSLFVSRTGFPDGTPSRQKLMKARYERGEMVQTWCHQEFMCRCRSCLQVVAMNSVERATETVVRVGARPRTKILHKLETGLTRFVWRGRPRPRLARNTKFSNYRSQPKRFVSGYGFSRTVSLIF